MAQMQHFTSWGLRKAQSELMAPAFRSDARLHPRLTTLPVGLGRSYGDSALNDGGAVLSNLSLKRIISFDSAAGLLRAESGASFYDLLQFLIPHGFFLPVVPGTQYVTLAGAVANDIHGKNHHRAGNFGRHVMRFELLRSSGEKIVCSREENAELFRATIGGLGLTGFISWVEISVPKIKSSIIDQEIIPFDNLDDYFDLAEESDLTHEFTMSWIDVLSSRGNDLRGLYMRGNFADQGALEFVPSGKLLRVPFDLPDFTLNNFSVRGFNSLYALKGNFSKGLSKISYRPFFFPLDSVLHWNRIYGHSGFYQYQLVIPPFHAREATRALLNEITLSGEGSFLAVLKNFGKIESEGLLSFPREGVTMALDFRDQGKKTLELFDKLDRIVFEAGGALYPAKDGRMNHAAFVNSVGGEDHLQEFAKYKDPKFSSSFWRRVMNESSPA
ncbi:MAG: FAD-binding oxidoreductase [Bdellovibrionota bacterium]